MRAAALALALLATAACGVAAPPPRALPEPAPELSGGRVTDPLPAMVAAASSDFDRAGARLQGDPAATALAAARLEWLALEAAPRGRLARVPDSFRFALERARDELRGSLAVRADAPGEEASRALLAAHRALLRRDESALDAALGAPAVFRAGVSPSPRARLAEPGPQPSAEIATAALRDEVRRLAQEGALGPRPVIFDAPQQGLTTSGFHLDTLPPR